MVNKKLDKDKESCVKAQAIEEVKSSTESVKSNSDLDNVFFEQLSVDIEIRKKTVLNRTFFWQV